MIQKFLIYLLFAYASLSLSCKEGQDKDASNLPVARGAGGEVVLVMDSAAWEGKLGEEIRETFMKAMPGLPQPEPYFDLRRVDPAKLNNVLRSARNMLYVTTLDNESPSGRRIRSYFTENSIKQIQADSNLFMYPKRNEFARGQDVLYLFGNTEQELLNNLADNRDQVRSYFDNIERDRIQQKMYSAGEDKKLSGRILQEHQFSIRVPFGYKQVPLENAENFVWLRQLGQDIDRSVFVYYQDYTSEAAFHPDSILALRNKVTRQYIADSKDVYMVMQEQVPVDFDTVTFRGKYALEARGLWKLNNNSMGGPFLSYTFVDQDLGRLYYIEGFVYSPGKDKRPYIREIDAILDTFKTASKQKGKQVAS